MEKGTHFDMLSHCKRVKNSISNQIVSEKIYKYAEYFKHLDANVVGLRKK